MTHPRSTLNAKRSTAALPPVILLMGPTASGKTALAAAIAAKLPVEIVSVDSAQVYRHMNIGTAKPGGDLLASLPHHLIDLIEPHESYSAARFRDDALAVMREITERGNIPMLVGGTMLYFQAIKNMRLVDEYALFTRFFWLRISVRQAMSPNKHGEWQCISHFALTRRRMPGKAPPECFPVPSHE